MKIIHLLSNWKWTERSELAIDLAVSQRRLGEDVWLVCGQAPPDIGSVTDVSFNARQKGLDRVIALPEMTKHSRIFSMFRGGRKLRGIIDTVKPDVIHCHMRNAHLLAGLAGQKNDKTPCIRSVYNPDQVSRDFRSRWCYRNYTRGIIVVTDKAGQSALSQSFPSEKIAVMPPGIDLERFSPTRTLDGRKDFGLPEDCFVAGIVSRIRQTRRIDIPLTVLKQLGDRYPRLRLLIVGRGRPGAVEKVIERPADDLGIRDKILLAGYCAGDDLVAAFRHMHVLLYPMPGTDRTCRTVREAMAAGVPVIAPDMEFLPELIQNGRNGYLVDQSPEGFASALQKLMDSPELLEEISGRALTSAQEHFNWQHLAEESLEFYTRVKGL